MVRSSRALFVLLAAALPTALGCEALLGLDGYSKVDDGGADAAPEADAQDAADETPVLFPDASVASRWPRWVMPNATPANPSSPDASADAGQSVANEARYMAGTTACCDGGSVPTITDVTPRGPQLIWMSKVVEQGTLAEAKAYCASFGFRLPTRIELVTILDAARSTPPLVPSEFGTEGAGAFWTQSPVLLYPSGATEVWAVDFGVGGVVRASTSTKKFVRCVTGGVPE